jgi:putative exosortase-associated protein (TIGR04073 family)
MKTKVGLVIFLLLIVFLCSATTCVAADDTWERMGNKLKRGFINVITGWVELPVQVIRGYKDGGEEIEKGVLGAVGGVFKGILCALGRTSWGVVELAGFWAAGPEDNIDIGLSLDAEYVWDDMDFHDTRLDMRGDKIGLIGNKLLRGAENILFGFVELPGQVTKGIKNRTIDYGITKGMWFWCSREISGVADLVTLILPIERDNTGCVFDEKRPWEALAEAVE